MDVDMDVDMNVDARDVTLAGARLLRFGWPTWALIFGLSESHEPTCGTSAHRGGMLQGVHGLGCCSQGQGQDGWHGSLIVSTIPPGVCHVQG